MTCSCSQMIQHSAITWHCCLGIIAHCHNADICTAVDSFRRLLQEKVPHRVATLDISDELECLGLWQQTNFLPKVDLQDIVIRANSSIPGTPRIVQRHAHHLHAPEIELSTELRPHEGMVSSSRQQTGLGSIASLQGWPQQYGAGSEICAVPCLQDWHHQTCSNGSLG